MTAAQRLKLFHLAQRYVNNTEEASAFLAENKIDAKKDILATKDDINAIKIEMKDQKAEIIKRMFIFWTGQITATIGMILLFVKK